MRRQNLPTMLSVVAVALSGCSKPGNVATGEVKGLVTLQGVPFSEGSVVLYSAQSGTGTEVELQEDGHFVVRKAIPVGDYSIRVVPPSPPPPEPGVRPVSIKSPAQGGIPLKYRDANTSGLTLTVAPGENYLEVAMEARSSDR